MVESPGLACLNLALLVNFWPDYAQDRPQWQFPFELAGAVTQIDWSFYLLGVRVCSYQQGTGLLNRGWTRPTGTCPASVAVKYSFLSSSEVRRHENRTVLLHFNAASCTLSSIPAGGACGNPVRRQVVGSNRCTR